MKCRISYVIADFRYHGRVSVMVAAIMLVTAISTECSDGADEWREHMVYVQQALEMLEAYEERA
jgi:hypothetical protein